MTSESLAKVTNIKIEKGEKLDLNHILKANNLSLDDVVLHNDIVYNLPKKEYLESITPYTQSKITFDLINSHQSVAIAFKRILMGEYLNMQMTTNYVTGSDELVDKESTTSYLFIKQRIECIAVNYDPSLKDLRMMIDVKNNSDTKYMLVHSNRIKFDTDKTKGLTEIDFKKLQFDKNIMICSIAPRKSLKIEIELKIGANTGSDKLNYRTCNNHSFTYKLPEFENINSLDFKISNLSIHAKNFKLGFECSHFIEPKVEIVRGINAFIKTLDTYKEIIKNIKDTTPLTYGLVTNEIFRNELLTISKVFNESPMYIFDFYCQTHTLGNIIAWFYYKDNMNTPLICVEKTNANDDFIRLNVGDQHFSQKIPIAIENAKKEFIKIKSYFE